MAAPLLRARGLSLLLRSRFQHTCRAVGLLPPACRHLCSVSQQFRSDEGVSIPKDQPVLRPRLDDPNDDRNWKEREAEILSDIEPITKLTKEILHSDRYKDGQYLTAEHEKSVVDMLLAYHPHSEDKIGCGVNSIMVDRHPMFSRSRCLFVVRVDGEWADFSYVKCLCAYIRKKYPSDAERFISTHYKRTKC